MPSPLARPDFDRHIREELLQHLAHLTRADIITVAQVIDIEAGRLAVIRLNYSPGFILDIGEIKR